MSNHFSSDRTHEPIEIEEIEALLRTYRPTPNNSLRERVANATWMKSPTTQAAQEARPEKVNSGRKITTRLAFTFLSILVFIALVFLSPIGHSLAQAVSRFFKLAPSERVTEVVPLTPFPTPDPGYPYNLYPLNITQAEELAGFKVKELTSLPANWVFHGAKYEPENQQVELFYTLPSMQPVNKEDIYLYVSEMKGEFENFEWGQCPNGAIEEVMVNGWPAELSDEVVWVTMTAPTPGITRQWECQKVDPGTFMTLRWKETDLKYEINVSQLSGDTSLWLTKQGLIDLAENMKD